MFLKNLKYNTDSWEYIRTEIRKKILLKITFCYRAGALIAT